MAELHRRPKTDLPSEIQLFHILPRLPVKSVVRFKSVSKQWHSFIKTHEFVKMHLHHVTNGGDQHNHLKLLLLSCLPYKRRFKFSIINCEAPEDGSSVRRFLPFKDMGKDVSMVASFHGLICIGMYKKRSPMRDYTYSDIVLWNPLTGDYKTLSKDCSQQECYYDRGGKFGLYYTSSDDDYKLLHTTQFNGIYIYSLKSDSWRKLEPTCTLDVERNLQVQSCWPKTIVLNDRLYCINDASIIRFDIKTEKFTDIKFPSCIRFFQFVTVSEGSIHLFAESFRSMTELWRMDGEDECWTKVGPSIYFPDIPGCCPPRPLHCLARNGNWLMKSYEKSSLYELDPKTRISKFMCSYVASGKYPDMIKFVGTLVSPNQYMN